MERCFTAYRTLRREMDAWLAQSRRMDPPSLQGGGEDEANYALAWFPHFLVGGSHAVVEHFEGLRDLLAGWVERECLHGYEPEAEAHHGTEPFLLFLPRFLGLFPDDATARALLEDAAHHIGNWVPEIPAWFDWERNRFYGYHIGTRTVGRDRAFDCELAEHFRFVHIALAAHRVLGEARYLDWALRYGRRRAEMIVAVPEGPLPVVWGPDGEPVWEKDLTGPQARMSADSHHVAGDPLKGLEVFLASGVIYALGDLFRASGEAVFRAAARRIAAPMVEALHDPYGDPGAAAVSYYRRTFGDDSLDGRVQEQVAGMPEEEEGELVMMFPEAHRRVQPGVGKRADMIWWGVFRDAEQGSVVGTREPSTAALTLAFEMTGDVAYAARALRQAGRKLKMARRVLRGGREHADMGGAVCSVAAGHGRNWGCGAVTGCYGPMLLGTREVRGAVRPAVEVRQEGDRQGLPEEVLSLVVSPEPGPGWVRFFNGGNAEAEFAWRPEGGAWRAVTLKPGEESRCELESCGDV